MKRVCAASASVVGTVQTKPIEGVALVMFISARRVASLPWDSTSARKVLLCWF